jgi:hypothetical protein
MRFVIRDPKKPDPDLPEPPRHETFSEDVLSRYTRAVVFPPRPGPAAM